MPSQMLCSKHVKSHLHEDLHVLGARAGVKGPSYAVTMGTRSQARRPAACDPESKMLSLHGRQLRALLFISCPRISFFLMVLGGPSLRCDLTPVSGRLAAPYLPQQGHHPLAPRGRVVHTLHLEHVEDLGDGRGRVDLVRPLQRQWAESERATGHCTGRVKTIIDPAGVAQ